MNILNMINSPSDLQELNYKELDELSTEIRDFLIEKVSKNGGHLASNLGAVELTLAIHRVYNTESDRLIFDVGHQCYVHKILTGRQDGFEKLRRLGGISGFPKPSESEHDAFIAGHASNSVSVALGMTKAQKILDENYSVVCLIGDGALSGGLAYEGLSNAGSSGEPLVVILNDNEMSISQNVGGTALMLSRLRVKSGYIQFKRAYRRVMRRFPKIYRLTHKLKEAIKDLFLPSNIFIEMGFYYLGPVDGHNIKQLEDTLNMAKDMQKPVLLHVKTQKGRGYPLAEADPSAYHGVSAFDPKIGVKKGSDTFSDVFGSALCDLAEKDNSIVAITAAMSSGTGLTNFAKNFPDRTFDVGIAEGHAVSMAAGLAAQGICPVFAVYSSFLQRTVDMMIHDVALSKHHVVFAVDRAGIVGADGETHNGVYDISLLKTVPYMTILCPSSYEELRQMLDMAVNIIKTPVAVRYPRGTEGLYKESMVSAPVVQIGDGEEIALITYGTMINDALDAKDLLEKADINVKVIKLNIINPLDKESIISMTSTCKCAVVIEEVCSAGSVGQELSSVITCPVQCINLGDGILNHGEVRELKTISGLDAESIAKTSANLLNNVIEEMHNG